MKSETPMKKHASNSWLLVLPVLFLLNHAGLAVAGPELTAEGAKKYFGDVNAPTEIDTRFGKKSLLPLQLAAGNSDDMGLNMIRALIEAGALPNKIGPDGDAALHTACSRGAVKNIRLLVESGADVNLKNKQGETALLKAIDYRKFDAASVLIDLGADVNIADSKGNTAVHAAAQEGNVEQAVSMLKQIMQHGGKIDVRNTEGYTPLYALLLNATPKSKPMVQFLLAAGANPNVKDPSGNTVLHNIASEQTDQRDKLVPLLESLIKVGAQVNARNILGETPLYKAVFEDCYLGAEPVISRYLLEHGTDADIKANDGSTAISISRLPELNCQQPIREMLANSQGKQASTAHPSGPQLDAVINAYAAHVDKAGRAYQQAKQKAAKARGFSDLSTRQAVQARQHLFADFKDKAINLIVLLKDAKTIAWKAVQDNKVKASREASDKAVSRKFGKRITKDGLQSLRAQFYWADAYYNVFTMLDQHWGAWSVDEAKHMLNAPDKDLQAKLNKEMKAIADLESYLNQQGK